MSVTAAFALVASACGGPPGSTTRGPAGDYTAPASIASDCSRDVTADLLRWVGSVGDGSVLRFAPAGCYRIDGTLRFENRNDLTFEGNGATFKPLTDGTELGAKLARGRAQFFVVGGSHITLENLNVHGARDLGLNGLGYSLEAQHAFAVGQTVGFHLKNVHVAQVYGDFVYVGPYTRDVLVEGSSFDSSSRMGWTVNGGWNITFTGNSIANVGHSTVDVEPPDTGSLDGLTISNNVVGPGRLGFFNVGGAPGLTFNNMKILNNWLIDKPMKIQAANWRSHITNFTVMGNRVTGAPRAIGVDQSGGGAFFIQNATGVTIRDNHVPMTWGRNITGVNLSDSHNVVVTDNYWDGGSGSVSYYDGLSTNVCWTGNHIHPSPFVLEAPSTPPC